MVEIIYDKKFQKIFSKIKARLFREQVKKQIYKIIDNPSIGKPMMYSRKGTRELYVNHFRLVYAYYQNQNIVEFLDLYHKDEQ